MRRVSGVCIVALVVLALFQVTVLSQTRERAEVLVEHTWRLEDLYTSDQTWNEAKQKLAAQFSQITKHKGQLATSASELLACLSLNCDISKDLSRLHCYAGMKSDQDTRNPKCLAMKQEMEQLATDYSSKASFIEPEIARMDKDKIDAFISQEPGLTIF